MQNTRSPKHARLPEHAIVSLHAEANNSDPFARARMSLTLRLGHDNPNEVTADARRILAARHARCDADHKAWMKSPERKEIMKHLRGASK